MNMGMTTIVWVIYRQPELFIARKHVDGLASREISHRDVDRLRDLFRQAGMATLPRHDSDDDDDVVERWAP
jgi:hypothetical protein